MCSFTCDSLFFLPLVNLKKKKKKNPDCSAFIWEILSVAWFWKPFLFMCMSIIISPVHFFFVLFSGVLVSLPPKKWLSQVSPFFLYVLWVCWSGSCFYQHNSKHCLSLSDMHSKWLKWTWTFLITQWTLPTPSRKIFTFTHADNAE